MQFCLLPWKPGKARLLKNICQCCGPKKRKDNAFGQLILKNNTRVWVRRFANRCQKRRNLFVFFYLFLNGALRHTRVCTLYRSGFIHQVSKEQRDHVYHSEK